ncbi:MAG: DUF2058 domain-containing protein [Desulfobacteraceae bacterium]|nr:DUF2058 domain-containing protein [Desulfobacteraceae bacterium]
MGNSLRDQLLKAGLVNKKQVKKAKHEKRVNKQQKKGKKPAKEDSISREERLAYEERNRELNRQRNEERKRRENLSQVKQLIETNRITLEERDDDEPYYFAMGKKIKKLFISEKISNQLTNGQLAIVNLNGKIELIPANAARQVADRDQKSIMVFNDPSTDS